MEVNFFMPKYMESFKCIGGECKDSCCMGWEINIDKETFNKYKNSKGTLKEVVLEKYHENPVHRDDSNYGFMNVKEDRCPFLNSDMLCDIHRQCGEENLSITCKRYPRVFNIVDEIYEMSGIPSCEEVCLKAFLNREKMEFVEGVRELDEETIEVRRIMDTEAFEDSLLEYFWEIRTKSINIMQNRSYTIETRLNILKDFYKELQRLEIEEDFDRLEMLLESDEISKREKAEILIEKEFCKDITSDSLYKGVKGVRIKKVIEECKRVDLDFDNEIYRKIDHKLEECDYIFENYLVNQIFKNMMPFDKGLDLNCSIKNLISMYKIIKGYIVVLASNAKNNVDEKLIIRVIQALSKDIEHNKVYQDFLK